jgi:acyl-CoA thioesterase-2
MGEVEVHSDPEDLVQRLDVESAGEDAWMGRLESFEGRTFGGEILAQATTALARSCPDRQLHSLHGYFLRPARPGEPVRYQVHRLRDGRRLAARRVAAQQSERLVAEFTASLFASSDGPEWQDDVQTEGIPTPETLPDEEARAASENRAPMQRPIDIRFVEPPWLPGAPGEHGRWRAWMRPHKPLPAEPALHAAALAYVSDLISHGATMRRTAPHFDWARFASLDHGFWIHGPARFDDWLLVDNVSERARDGRSLTRRTLSTPAGECVASMVQEAFFDVVAEAGPDDS